MSRAHLDGRWHLGGSRTPQAREAARAAQTVPGVTACARGPLHHGILPGMPGTLTKEEGI